jgi:diguanylate cyclase (GGDEF)-like protein
MTPTCLRCRELEAEVASLRAAALIDPLTGVANRRAFDSRYADAYALANRGTPFALALCDVDNFKLHNDSFGHVAGDRLLRYIALGLQSVVRDVDTLARYGGEEFAAILTHVTTVEDAAVAGERLRAVVARMPYEHRRATISVGVALWTPGLSPTALLQLADEALYDAKQAGRDTVRVIDPVAPSATADAVALLDDQRPLT